MDKQYKQQLQNIVNDMKKNLDEAKSIDQDKLSEYQKGSTGGRICELGIYYDKLNAFMQILK